MSRLYAGLAIIGLLAAGLFRLVRQQRQVEERQRLAAEFRERLLVYIRSRGRDGEAYAWLTHRGPRLQTDMGPAGVLGAYRPPFADYMINNYLIIVNMLPDLRYASEEAGVSMSSLFEQYAATLQEALIRYQGILHDRHAANRQELTNPIAWLREGTQFVLLVPLTVLASLGVGSASVLAQVSGNVIFRAVSAIVALITFLASVVTIITGAQPTARILETIIGP